MLKDVWITPSEKVHLINLHEKECYSDYTGNAGNTGVLELLMGEKSIPYKAIIKSFELEELTTGAMKSVASITRTDDKVYANYYSNRLYINTPFDDLTSIGNELAFWGVYKRKAITLRCSAVQYGDCLICFLGQSNTGKTTAMRRCLAEILESVPASDDHISLEIDNNRITYVSPIWDVVTKEYGEQKHGVVKQFIGVMLDPPILETYGVWDIYPHVVGASLYPQSAVQEFIWGELSRLKCTLISGKPRNIEENLRRIQKVLETKGKNDARL